MSLTFSTMYYLFTTFQAVFSVFDRGRSGGCAVCRRSVGFADDPVHLAGLQLQHQAVAEEQSGQVSASFKPSHQAPHGHQTFVMTLLVQQ